VPSLDDASCHCGYGSRTTSSQFMRLG
jgi:hypothetical protein